VIVVDASALLESLLRTGAAAAVDARLFAAGESLHAPHLIDVEVAEVLRGYAAAGDIDAGREREALEDLADLPLRRHPHDLLLPRAWELRDSLTVRDALYLAVAEALDAPLVTRDRRLSAATGHRARVELI
jgi:predicted nucleic acid-binding protein